MEYITNAPKGRDLLNDREPGWFRRINPEWFFIGDPHQCVLGQVYGSYERGKEVLFGNIDAYKEADRYGFATWNLHEHGYSEETLQAEWMQIITELQLGDSKEQ